MLFVWIISFLRFAHIIRSFGILMNLSLIVMTLLTYENAFDARTREKVKRNVNSVDLFWSVTLVDPI